jgi:hypothetical protein
MAICSLCGESGLCVPCPLPGFCTCPPDLVDVQGACIPLCSLGEFLNGTICSPCPIGFYCTSAQDMPTPCPAYATTLGVGKVNATDCSCIAGFVDKDGLCVQDCAPGHHLNETLCSPCPIGFYCTSAQDMPISVWSSPHCCGLSGCMSVPFGHACLSIHETSWSSPWLHTF